MARSYPGQTICFERARGLRSVAALVLCALLATGCGDCRGLRAFGGGAAPSFATCRAAKPRALRVTKLGALELRLKDRTLTITGAEPPITLAAFAGPAPGRAIADTALRAVHASNPSLTIALGGFGEDGATVESTLRGLATLPGLVLLLASGRDHPDHVAAALDAIGKPADHLVDITPLERVQLGSDTWIPVAGARDGRAAPDDDRCGYGLSDLKSLASRLGPLPEGERRFLLAAEAPAGEGPFAVARTDRGIDLGTTDLAELARRVGAPGGLFGGPHAQVLRPSAQSGARRLALNEAAPDLQLVVPRLGGPAVERSDGSRVGPAFALLSLDASGLRLSAAVEAP